MRKTVADGNGNELCGVAGRKEWEWHNTGRTRNGSREWEWALRGGGMGMAEHGMAAHPLPP
jgi:hypothetical protein